MDIRIRMLLTINVLCKFRTVVRAAQIGRKRDHIDTLGIPERLHIALRRRAGRLRAVLALLYPAKKIRLVKRLIIRDVMIVYTQFQRDITEMFILLHRIGKFSTTVNYNFICHFLFLCIM